MSWSYASNQGIFKATGIEAIDPMKLLTLADSTMIPVYKVTPEGIELLEQGGGRGASQMPLPNRTLSDRSTPSFVIKPPAQYVPDEVIVIFKQGSFEDNAKQITSLNNASLIQTAPHDNMYLIRISRSQPLNLVISELQKNTLVEYASPNYYVPALAVPNDPQYTNQWHLHRVAAQHGWDQTTGDSSIVLAILDTGVDPDHDEFAGKLFPGYDFINDDPEPYDDHGHGTHVAGIAAAATDNTIGIASVDWQTNIMPVKVLGEEGYGTSWTICHGIYFAADFGAKVINMSLGGYEYTAAYDSAIGYAHNHGSVVIAAAGNDNTNQPVYPGACEHVICIAATNKDDEKATFSNYGTYIDLSAPGVGILSTVPRNQYTYYNGTSMSTPLVSGLATLIFASNPLYGPAQVESLLTTYADDLGEPGWDEYYGHGRINVFKSLVGPMAVVLGYYGGTVLGDGVANTGEQFSMMISVLNSGDSSAYKVKATLSTDDPYVTIGQDYSRYGDIPVQGIVTGIDTFVVQFKSNMPKDHKVWFYLTIEDSLGIIYADGFMIKEGEYLPGFIGPKTMKDRLRGYVNRGYTVYLPQGNLVYKDFSGTGFASNDLEKMGGEGGSAWYTYEEWWERFGASCVHIFYADWYYAMSRFWELIYVECEITTPEHYAAFPIGDTIPIVVHYDAEFHYEPEHYSWDETYIWNTSEPPNLGAEWVPGLYQIWPVEYAWDRGFYYEESESRIYCLFTFEILEDFVKKYFNPLKPDSARVVYQIWPDLYADPKIEPSPKKMEVEIKDSLGTTVYGPRELDSLEMKDQVLFWNGKDNGGDTVSVTNNPYQVQIGLEYHNSNKCFRQTEVLRNNLNLKFDEVIEQQENTIGGFVFWNVDDDNNNKIKDNKESNLGASEDDLVPLTIEFDSNEEDGEIILSTKTTGTGEIKVWTSADKVEPISLPLKYQLPSEFPKTLWIEGDFVSNRPQDIQLVLEHHSSHDTYQDKVKATVFQLYAKFVAFNYDENSTNKDAINIRKDPDNVVEIPEWKMGEDLISDPERNDPAAYVMSNDSIRVMASFILRPGGIESVDLKAEIANPENSLGNLEWKNVEFLGIVSKGVTINNIPGFVDFTTEKGTGNSVNREEITWKWKVKNLQEVTGQNPLSLNTVKPCTIYTILAEPKPPWEIAGPYQVWSKALQYACDWARDVTSLEDAGIRITSTVYGDIGFVYDIWQGESHFGGLDNFKLSQFIEEHLTIFTPFIANCYDAAHIVCTFNSALGSASKFMFIDVISQLQNCIDPAGVAILPTNNPFGEDTTGEPEPHIHHDGRHGQFFNHAYAEITGTVFDATLRIDVDDTPDNVINSNPGPGEVENTTDFEFELPVDLFLSSYKTRLLDNWSVIYQDNDFIHVEERTFTIE
ncbi:MAG: S8 family peptidase [bacterium]